LPKVNVYLPEKLAEDVRAAKVSVSPVCQRALQQEVRRVNAMKEATSDLEKVAQRLRSTEDEEEKERFELGQELGREWAREYASVSELESVYTDFHHEYWASWDLGEKHSLGIFLEDSEDPDLESLGYDFRWVRERGQLEPDPLINGVIAGAAEVYEAVRPLLQSGHRGYGNADVNGCWVQRSP